ncbi:MAG: NAD(P)H-dependent oxidoreductase subunit E [Balneolaceae bacterium]
MKYEFTKDELDQIEKIKARFPEVKPATLPVLWLAQNKFGHVKPEVQKLVARTLNLPEAHVHGVAEFYTQYYKEEMGKYVLDVCTCLSCQLCGGYDILHYLEEKLDIKSGETTEDGMFSIQQVECLGACGYAPMLQISNERYVNHLTPEKIDSLIDGLRGENLPEFESMKMPQHQTKED